MQHLKSLLAAIAWALSPVKALLAMPAALFFRLILPSYMKRLFFVASLYAHLKQLNPKNLDESSMLTIMTQLNALLKLANVDVESLRLPMLYHHWIWKEVEVELEGLDDTSVQHACDYILSRTPCWCKYEWDDMRDDLQVILQRCYSKSCNNLQAAI
jgi:hypothetical protein